MVINYLSLLLNSKQKKKFLNKYTQEKKMKLECSSVGRANEELIWVDQEFAKKYNDLRSELNTREQQIQVLDEYIEKLSVDSRNEFKSNLESLEEDAAIYSGLMLKVKQSFEKAKNESLAASYKMWEDYAEELDGLKKKVTDTIKAINPLKQEINNLNDTMKNINTYSLERVIECINKISNLDENGKAMVSFLLNNFKS
jgi:DNA anti-recombination protein RmuC